jgi:hypothetical protein
MESRGIFSPETASEASTLYETVGPAAQTVVRETTRAMAFDAEEYDERVDAGVVETARDALFASLLEVQVGTDDEFESTVSEYSDYELEEIGNENVSQVAWHVAPAAEQIVAATFESKPEAAVGTLRRHAFGAVYRDLVQ